MSDDWKVGYREAVKEFLTERGMFVTKSGSTFYGWADYQHSGSWGGARCPVTFMDMSTLTEESLDQFAGTFVSSEMESGIEVRATCACRKYVNDRFRWTGTLTEILNHLLR